MKLSEKLNAQNNSDLPRHQLLGHPYQIQGDLLYTLRHDFHLEEEPTQWRLLLQVDTDDDTRMMWGDCGLLYFYISGQALARRDFSQALMITQWLLKEDTSERYRSFARSIAQTITLRT